MNDVGMQEEKEFSPGFGVKPALVRKMPVQEIMCENQLKQLFTDAY